MTSIAALFSAALGSYERDELVAAAAGFEQVLAADPAHVEARYKLANVRKEQGDLTAAESHYLDVLRRAPDYAEALNNLGAVHEMSGRPSEAEARYRESIAQRVDLAPPYANLGRLLQSQQRHDEAAALYRRALERGLDQALFRHLLDAVSGASIARLQFRCVAQLGRRRSAVLLRGEVISQPSDEGHVWRARSQERALFHGRRSWSASTDAFQPCRIMTVEAALETPRQK